VTYSVTAVGAGLTRSCQTSTTSCTLSGLTNGVNYNVSVIATSYAGSSVPATVTGSPATNPSAPTAVTATGGNGMLDVSWQGQSDGGRLILDYTVTLNPGGAICVTTTESCRITDVINGQQYTATVIARTVWGSSVPSAASSPVRPATNPSAPWGVSTTRGNHTAVVTWSPPVNDGGEPVTGYRVFLGEVTLCETTTTNCTITDLTNGVPVSFSVVAFNAVGTSEPSTPSAPVTPATIPGSPNPVWASRGDQTLTVGWSEPSDGGEPIIGYTVSTLPASDGCASLENSCTITALTNGVDYAVFVVARNAVGPGPSSEDDVRGVPATTPAAPNDLLAQPDMDGVVVNWTEPDSGGEPIVLYRVAVWIDASLISEYETSVTSLDIPSLVYPDDYRITVEAINIVGASIRAVVHVTPLAPPPPVVEPPVVEPPVVEPPVVEPPVVEPPIVEPPIVEPPVVEPPIVEPPAPPTITAPASPRGIRLTFATNKGYTLSWGRPADGGAPISDYRIAKRLSGSARYTPVNDGVSARRTAFIPRPKSGKTVYIRLTSVNAAGQSNPATIVAIRGKTLYEMPRVVAVRFSDAAAFVGFDARSTPYDGTSNAKVFDHASFL
ncbi:MAG: hypothetical protein RLZZ587_622, partial [Actinomycetota bacterium]